MGFKFGIDVLLKRPDLLSQLKGKRISLLGHPASMTTDFVHTLDALAAVPGLKLTSAFGPQHGMRGEKQDNMVESDDYQDPVHNIPVFSLYGKVRRPTPNMMETFDVILVDLQDLGTRVYTFLTTLFYILEAANQFKKEVWILDRPNPAGRPVEGTLLDEKNWSSFVGAAAMPMRHGLTLGEAARWFIHHKKLQVESQVVQMEGYFPNEGPGFGWPLGIIPWVNPSPNAAGLSMARCYPGTVLLEGTHLSEGRGTTHPLELQGAPGLSNEEILKWMQEQAPSWLRGARLRPCYFQPTFHKFSGELCSGFQIHVDDVNYQHQLFKPYRVIALWLKAIRNVHPDFSIWRDFHYEYEKDRLAIDIITGGTFLREWVDDPTGLPSDFDARSLVDEKTWEEQRKPFLIYS